MRLKNKIKMINGNSEENIKDDALTTEVRHVVIRKTPKFPSRERHMAIRRKKPAIIEDETKGVCLEENCDSKE